APFSGAALWRAITTSSPRSMRISGLIPSMMLLKPFAIRLTSLFLSGHVPDHALATAVGAGQVAEPEDLHHSGGLVNGLLPAAVPEVAVVHVRTELDVLRIEEPHRPFRARSEERRVGKECRGREWRELQKKKAGWDK